MQLRYTAPVSCVKGVKFKFRGDFMRILKKAAAVLLTFCLVSGLAACGGTTQEQKLPQQVSVDPVETENVELVNTLVMRQEALPGDITELSAMNSADEGMLLAGRDSEGKAVLGFVDAEGGFKSFDLPEDVRSVEAVCRTETATAALAATDTGMCLLGYGDDGRETRTDLDTEDASILYGDLGLAMKSGKFYVMYYIGIVEFGPDGKVSRSCYGEEKYNYFTAMQEVDGRVYVAMGDGLNGGGSLCELDTEAMSLTAVDTGGASVNGLGLSRDGGLLVSASQDGRQFSALLDESGLEELFDWSEPGLVKSNYTGLWQLGDGSYVLYRPGATTLERLSEEMTVPRTELRLLTDFGRSEVYAVVNAFNLENEEYKVKVETLGEDGLTQELLTTQLISGDGPDIFAFFSYDNLARLGSAAVEDLLPYLESDGDYGYDTFVPGLMEAMSLGGRLDALPYAFSVSTFTAPSGFLQEPGVTYSEAEEAAATAGLPMFPAWMTRDTLWGWLREFAAGQFVDFEAGTCSFDSEGYVSLLEKCAEMGTEIPADTSILNTGLLQFEQLQNLIRLAVVSENYSGAYTFAGAPNDETNGSMFTIDLAFAISAQSKHKDGAWQLLRTCLRPDMQELSTMFPASAAVFDEKLRSMEETGEELYGTWYQLTESDSEKLRELIDGTQTVQYSRPTVTDIMDEDAAQFFAGQISARQAAEYTQSRVSTWLAEHS